MQHNQTNSGSKGPRLSKGQPTNAQFLNEPGKFQTIIFQSQLTKECAVFIIIVVYNCSILLRSITLKVKNDIKDQLFLRNLNVCRQIIHRHK